MKTRIAVFVSGGGTNLQALIDAQKKEILISGEIVLVISNIKNAYALKRAHLNNINTLYLSPKEFNSESEYDDKLISVLKKNNIQLIVLAGYLSILHKRVTDTYKNRIINVHPSLIPSFCGAGYYGLKVHEEVLKYGVKVSGATVHFANEIPDAGEIIMQKAVYVKDDDTPQSLQKRIMRLAEHVILPKSVELISKKIIDEGDNYEPIRY